MSLYDVSFSYVHSVDLNDYVMTVLLGMIEVVYVALLMCEVNGMLVISLRIHFLISPYFVVIV